MYFWGAVCNYLEALEVIARLRPSQNRMLYLNLPETIKKPGRFGGS